MFELAGFDYKKEFKELYQPPGKPVLIDVPRIRFIMVDGEGYPAGNPAYEEAIQVLCWYQPNHSTIKKSLCCDFINVSFIISTNNAVQ